MNDTTPVCTIPCNLCGGSDIEVLATQDRKGRPLQTVICRACGLAWTDPRPAAAATRAFYAEHYRRQYKSTLQPKLKHVYRDMKRAITRFNRVRPLLAPGMKLLDIGAGGGFFPYVVSRNGFAVTGLEPNAGYASYAREEFHIDITTGFIQDAEYGSDSFDVITLNHVLEHLEDPCQSLTRMHAWLKQGGFLIVEVPNIEATYHAPGNKFHPAHLYTFNPVNLQRLGERAGFKIHDLQIVPETDHINVIFQKSDNPAAEIKSQSSCAISGNYARIRKIYDAHTTWSHFSSARPYTRVFRKLAAYLREWLAVSRFATGRDIADFLIEH